MEVRAYTPDDFAELMTWHAARGIGPAEPQALPSCGFIAPGVAAGFLFRTDSTAGFIGNYLSNPDASLHDRFRALKIIAAALVNVAPRLGVKQLVVISKARSIRRLADQLGFTDLGQVSMLGREF